MAERPHPVDVVRDAFARVCLEPGLDCSSNVAHRVLAALAVQALERAGLLPPDPPAEGAGPARARRSPRFWTAAEDDVVRHHYPRGGARAVREVLPERGWNVIVGRAGVLGVRAPVRGGAKA